MGISVVKKWGFWVWGIRYALRWKEGVDNQGKGLNRTFSCGLVR